MNHGILVAASLAFAAGAAVMHFKGKPARVDRPVAAAPQAVAEQRLPPPVAAPIRQVVIVETRQPASSRVYRWKDRNGAWHFSDQPPSGVNAEIVDVPAPNRMDAQPVPVSNRRIQSPPPVQVYQAPARARPGASVEYCKEQMDAALKRVADQMKRGYREPRGNRLRDRRERFSELRYECNSNPYAYTKAGHY